MVAPSQYILPNDLPVALLDCSEAFLLLSAEEKLYTHYLSRASFYGGLIVLFQTSPESPAIYILLNRLFRSQEPGELKDVAVGQGLNEDEYQAFLVYATGFFANMGNYKSFGDTKFVPNVPREKLEKLVRASNAFAKDPEGMDSLWRMVSDRMYSLEPSERQLGLGDQGISTYFSGNCTLEDAELAQRFLDSKSISAYNTRLFKTVDESGKNLYEVRLASVNREEMAAPPSDMSKILGSFEYEGHQMRVTRGDYSPLLRRVSENLENAKAYASNDNQRQMLHEYGQSFREGLIKAHKEGSKYWVQDKGPIVESYIGFIESYRDPFGSRGEFEGFVAVVNKSVSARFAQLVSVAEKLVSSLPWPACYEKDAFLRPDFTSLDVVTFSGSGIPAGINIPNYDDIRQTVGFKNVSLGNVLSVGSATEREKLTFLREEDKDLFIKFRSPSFEVQVGLHELLGHGSGKLFVQDEKGAFNFDKETVINPETGELVKSWYKTGETWDSKFSTIASSYEECRAECVGLYLCINEEVLQIFGHEAQEAQDVMYVNWLNMVRAGLMGLEYYTPETGRWRQAHMQARFVILHVLLEAGQNFVTISQKMGADGRPDAQVTLDREKILSVGHPAIQRFLLRLQVYKSTAEVERAREMYDGYSAVTDADPYRFLTLRDIVILRKEERKSFVQINTRLTGDSVDILQYESSPSGLILSVLQRFPDDEEELEREMLELSQFWVQQGSR
ncbi:dipeptidyl-peptidase 3 L homeolog [Xenopus laevis]|uniref:Dipeptidyl peptidase 3 n=1 Tax=Xenopus laevis TaxID=8355 RepID=Q6DE90_XENLA|nr:dipeptidyl-peptidase 3 L homeolog [Xenopus laevis]AAH77244.1 Dpp3-prov protein [Xenopus laevis]